MNEYSFNHLLIYLKTKKRKYQRCNKFLKKKRDGNQHQILKKHDFTSLTYSLNNEI